MPFQIFRRHRRKLLAALAILAMFAFVLADSLPRLFSDYARPTSVDRVVVKMDGSDVRQSDLELLKIQRIRSNSVLAQLGLRLGGMSVPYFEPQVFGGIDDASMVNAMLLQRKADQMGIPRSIEMAKNWIFEQARLRHELFRNLQPTLPAFDPIDLAEQLQFVFSQSYGRELTEAAFLADVADQVRIQQTFELLSQSMETPLDAFEIYSNQMVEVEARYASFPAEDFLDEVPSPDDSTLRDYFEERADRLPDPSLGRVGFRVPRRAKIEYLALGINAIDILREQTRGEALEEEIRGAEGFERDVLEQYERETEEREAAQFGRAIPVNPFTDPEDGEGIALSYPPEYEREYLDEQVDLLVQERLRDRIEDILEPVKQAMNDFSYDNPVEFDEVQTGLEPGIDRDSLPDLAEVFRSGESGRQLVSILGPAANRDEGISFVRIGLTRLLAEPGTFEQLLDPGGMPQAWRDYLALSKLEWADAPYTLLRSVQRLTRAVEGVERPSSGMTDEFGTFVDVMFEDESPLFDPREFTDREGRRYLVWKTLDFQETNRTFDEMPEGLVESFWRRDRARTLAAEAAERLAERVREEAAGGERPVDALERIAQESGLAVRSTGPRRRAESLSAYAPIDAGPEFQERLFQLGDSGEDAALIAPDRNRDVAYVLTLSRRGDSSLGGGLAEASDINYENALSNLQFFLRSEEDRAFERERVEAVMGYLREEAGIDPDWSPEDSGTS